MEVHMTERRRAVRAAVVMPKGGVGKTATAAALAWGLREHKKRTLVIDLDPQMADLSLVLGVDKLKAEYTSRELMLHPEHELAPVKLDEYVDLVPADPDPVLTEMRLGKETMVSGPVKLRRALDKVENRYDFILCDCRPGGGAVMANALVACKHIVAPVQLTRFAASCIVEMNTILSEVFDGQARPAVRYLPTFWTSDRESAEALEFVEENCRGALYGTRIPRAVAIARSMAEAASLFGSEFSDSKGAEAYRAFVEEFLLHTEADHEGHYVIVWGERRWRAAQLAELATVPAIINLESKHVRRRQLYENVMREDLNGVELARIVVQTMEEDSLDSKGMADQLHWPLRKVQRLVEIHEAPALVKTAMVKGVEVEGGWRVLSNEHALDVIRAYRHLAREDKSEDKAKALARLEKLIAKVLGEDWSSRKLRTCVSDLGRREVSNAPAPRPASRPASTGAEEPGPEDVSVDPGPVLELTDTRFVIDLARARCGGLTAGLRADLVGHLRRLLLEFETAA